MPWSTSLESARPAAGAGKGGYEPTFSLGPCQTDESVFRRNAWPVCASLGVHGALGGVLLIFGAASPPREAQVIERDIWIGETLEAVENGRDPSETTTGPASLPPPATPPARGADVAPPPPKAAVTPPPAGD